MSLSTGFSMPPFSFFCRLDILYHTYVEVPQSTRDVHIRLHGFSGRHIAPGNLCARAILLNLKHLIPVALCVCVGGGRAGRGGVMVDKQQGYLSV